MFLNPEKNHNLNYSFSNSVGMRNLQEQVKKAFCYKKLFWPFTVWMNCSNYLNNFGNKIPFLEILLVIFSWSCTKSLQEKSFQTVHRGAFCQFIFRWGFGKPLLRILGFTENKKCSPEKVSIIMYLQIDTLHTQKLEFIHLELACSRPGQQKWFFGEC